MTCFSANATFAESFAMHLLMYRCWSHQIPSLPQWSTIIDHLTAFHQFDQFDPLTMVNPINIYISYWYYTYYILYISYSPSTTIPLVFHKNPWFVKGESWDHRPRNPADSQRLILGYMWILNLTSLGYIIDATDILLIYIIDIHHWFIWILFILFKILPHRNSWINS